MYYIFKIINEEGIEKGFGFLTDDNASEDSKKRAYCTLEVLPEVPEDLIGKKRQLTETSPKNFSWKEKEND
jgi:hypothetical protein